MHPIAEKILSDIIGWIGALLFFVSYLLLIIKTWKATSVAFHVCNILGGFFVGLSALYDRSYPSAIINIIWGLIAVYGLYTDKLKQILP
ncbi:hypothetical protein EOD41_11835 [Mucilaginibacter limnophilus]|uniref:CBU-0592-like domain-containing protein n=1 Tax=Mucilaginibacter limnophilus TaxID=1932778 RepID=A0A3S2ULJ7_9SPHI|nr:hypothetical protein [Mucilaginibacter limnophilus]RVU00681.1 hypothetical protein EOD41_11835 [Mucilaginibacter limnophilus]